MDLRRTIRIARSSDTGELARLAGELGYPTTGTEMESRFDSLVSNSQHGVFVAELDAIIGWIHVAIVHSLESSPFAEIRGLVIAKSHRNLGIGTALVTEAEGWARKNGCDRIRVRTNVARERTLLFYRKLGFQSIKTQEVFDKSTSS